jgi:hypothetical protein
MNMCNTTWFQQEVTTVSFQHGTLMDGQKEKITLTNMLLVVMLHFYLCFVKTAAFPLLSISTVTQDTSAAQNTHAKPQVCPYAMSLHKW